MVCDRGENFPIFKRYARINSVLVDKTKREFENVLSSQFSVLSSQFSVKDNSPFYKIFLVNQRPFASVEKSARRGRSFCF